MIKTKTAWKRVLLILIAAVTMFTVFAGSFPKASVAVTYPFNVIRTLAYEQDMLCLWFD